MCTLTVRQSEILALLSTGLTNRGIGWRLHISPNTVRNHIATIYEKLGISSRAQAAVAAYVRARGHDGRYY